MRLAALALLLALAGLACHFGQPAAPAPPVLRATDPPPKIDDAWGVPMALVPAGWFAMGDDADTALAACRELAEPYTGKECRRDWFESEEPVHAVALAGYYIDRYEVSNARYAACVAASACQPPRQTDSQTRERYYGAAEFEDYPVIGVTWDMAAAYCQWRDASLPTEAQWEKAARGPDQRQYPWGAKFDGLRLNFCDVNCGFTWANPNFDDGQADTAPIGWYPQGVSPYGVFDLAGNVWEWVADWFDAGYYGRSPAQDPAGPAQGTRRVIRGGSWDDAGLFVRTSLRNANEPRNVYNVIGFRCARSI